MYPIGHTITLGGTGEATSAAGASTTRGSSSITAGRACCRERTALPGGPLEGRERACQLRLRRRRRQKDESSGLWPEAVPEYDAFQNT